MASSKSFGRETGERENPESDIFASGGRRHVRGQASVEVMEHLTAHKEESRNKPKDENMLSREEQ